MRLSSNGPALTFSTTRKAVAVMAGLLVLALVSTSAPIAPSQAAVATKRAAKSSISVWPKVFVGGQALTFSGALGRKGEQRVRLQMNMGNSASWNNVPGSSARTNSAGKFRIVHPAPAMYNISYRVASAKAHSPAVVLRARSQEIILSHSTSSSGKPFTITADTAPALRGGGLDLTPPIFAGRRLTLQTRNGTGWRKVGSTNVDTAGKGQFEVTETAAGEDRVYRVRAENYFAGKNRVGWFPSFPLYVPIGAAARATVASQRSQQSTAFSATSSPAPMSQKSTQSTAAKARKWGQQLFDFAWEFGESLNSRAYRGTRLNGRWAESSDGTGRVASWNGGLALQSQMMRSGLSDHGTTAATLQGNAQRTGRWEFRLRAKTDSTSGRPYRALVELVPESTGTDECVPSAITVADLTVGGSKMLVGVTSPKAKKKWSKTVNGLNVSSQNISVAVEVSRKHISWFANGRLVATVKSKSAVPGVKLTPRLSLVGAGADKMQTTMLHSDWQRGWTLKRGSLAKGGPGLKRTSFTSTC